MVRLVARLAVAFVVLLAPAPAAAHSAAGVVRGLLAGIPESGNVLGSANAPVTLQVFDDLECPICKQAALGAIDRLIPREVRSGRLRIEYHSLETASRERNVFLAQETAALAAGRQDRLWYFVELFLHEQGQEGSGYVTEAYLRGIARQVPGLNLAAWNAARRDPQLTADVLDDERLADRRHLVGTPSFFIGATGKHLRYFEPANLESPASFEAAIERLLDPSGKTT